MVLLDVASRAPDVHQVVPDQRRDGATDAIPQPTDRRRGPRTSQMRLFWSTRDAASYLALVVCVVSVLFVVLMLGPELGQLPEKQKDLFVSIMAGGAVASFHRFRRTSDAALADEQVAALLRQREIGRESTAAVREVVQRYLESNSRDGQLDAAFDRAAAEAVLRHRPGVTEQAERPLLGQAVTAKVREFLRSPDKQAEHCDLAEEWRKSVMRYRDDNETIGFLGLLNRDASACAERFSEFWDRHALSDQFVEDEAMLSVIMRDIDSLIDTVIELNRILDFRKAALGQDPRKVGLVVGDADGLLPVSTFTEGARHFQSAGRALQEALNRYIDVKRVVRQLSDLDDAVDADDPLLNVMGGDIAKGLRLFRSLSFSKVFHEQRGALYCVQSYLQAAEQRYVEVEAKLAGRPSGTDRDLRNQFDLLRNVLISDVRAAQADIKALLEENGEPQGRSGPTS